MKQKFIPVAILAAVLALAALVPPLALQGAPEDDAAAVVALVAEITEQQASLVQNQKSIDAALVEVNEELRLARIFSARSGGGKKAP